MNHTLTKPGFWLSLVGIALAVMVFLVFIVAKKSQYETYPVRRGEILEAVYGLGTVRNPSTYDVTIGVSNIIDQVFVREGDQVKVGTALVRMDDGVLFRSPIVGVITRVDGRKSELVPPQKTIVRVENQRDRYIEVILEQQGALRVREKQKAQVLFESMRGERFQGVVTSLFSRNDEFLAHIEVQGLPDSILPGMTADVAIEVARNPNALLIPLSSLDSDRVIVLRHTKKEKIVIKVGAIDATFAEVLEGDLREGDLVIISKNTRK